MIKLTTVRHNLKATEEMLLARGEVPLVGITSLPELNEKVWGIKPKKLTIIAGRPGNCKSVLGMQLAWDSASQVIPTLFVSIEMPEEDLIERLFCHVMKIDNYELLKGKFRTHYQEQWAQFMVILAGKKLIVTSMVGRSWKEIDEYLRSIPNKPKVIIIDHVQEARDAGLANQKAVIDEYVKGFRTMAIEFDFAGVLLSQIGRSGVEDERRMPGLHHLKGSGCLEECADTVFILHWPWLYTRREPVNDPGYKERIILNVAKNRNGRTGWITLRYIGKHYLFEDAPPAPKAERKKRGDHNEPKEQEELNWTE